MRGNHDAGCWRGVVGRLFANALSAKLFADDRVVHQLAQNGQWGFLGEGLRLGDGIADAETNPKMFRNDDLHLLCVTKLWDKFLFFLPAPCHSERKRQSGSDRGISYFYSRK
jgi:hypothetical protein